MSCVASEGLRLVFKVLVNKLRDKSAGILNHRDVTDETFREIIVRELKDIREKLDGLCKAELCASANFFKDGVSLLYLYLAEAQPYAVRIEKETYKNHKTTDPDLDEWEVFHILKDGFSTTLLKSDHSTFKEAKAKFFQASESATKAFGNSALPICDRILAMKFRVCSSILEHLDKPQLAIVLCKNYLEQLNSLPEVEESFEVKFGGFNMRRWFCEMRRDTLISSVISMNRMLWEFMHVCEKGKEVLSDWPEVLIASDRNVHPIFHAKLIQPFLWSFGEYGNSQELLDGPIGITTNSQGEFIVADRGNKAIKLFSASGKYIDTYQDLSLEMMSSSMEALVVQANCLLLPQNVVTDAADNIYISKDYKSNVTKQHVNEIVALDKAGKVKWRIENWQLGSRKSKLKGLAVDEANTCLLAMFRDSILAADLHDGRILTDNTINLCDRDPPVLLGQDSSICVSDSAEYLIAGLTCIYIIDRTGSLRGSIKPKTNSARKFYPCGISYDKLSQEIIVADRASNSLMMFKHSGVFVRRIAFPSQERYLSGGVTVMRNGHVAVANRNNSIINVF